MLWSDVVSEPSLKDLPFKIETNEQGQLVMSPHKRIHAIWQGEIEWRLRECLPEGRTAPEFAVDTRLGTKTPDVVWYPRAREGELLADQSLAPDICVEVLSATNTETEMELKRRLYFDAGAREVWLCDESGSLRFFGPDEEWARSALAPDFPSNLPSC